MKVGGMPFVPDIQPAKVAQPSEQSLDLPAPFVAAQRTSILRLRSLASAPVRSNQLDTLPGEQAIHRVGIIRSVANQPFGDCLDKAGVDGGGNEDDFMMRSRLGTNGERKTSAVCHCHDLRTFAPLGFSHLVPPFF